MEVLYKDGTFSIQHSAEMELCPCHYDWFSEGSLKKRRKKKIETSMEFGCFHKKNELIKESKTLGIIPSWKACECHRLEQCKCTKHGEFGDLHFDHKISIRYLTHGELFNGPEMDNHNAASQAGFAP